mmetsp:Transcript_11159/g.26815  ORF Transcript_11159/g.26815 Transcript_11159/m.26815 type:complete len:109 (+) Transcript_11159:1258-1584(+)
MRRTCCGPHFSPANPTLITVEEISKIIGAGSNLEEDSVNDDKRPMRLLVVVVVIGRIVVLLRSSVIIVVSESSDYPIQQELRNAYNNHIKFASYPIFTPVRSPHCHKR